MEAILRARLSRSAEAWAYNFDWKMFQLLIPFWLQLLPRRGPGDRVSICARNVSILGSPGPPIWEVFSIKKSSRKRWKNCSILEWINHRYRKPKSLPKHSQNQSKIPSKSMSHKTSMFLSIFCLFWLFSALCAFSSKCLKPSKNCGFVALRAYQHCVFVGT